MKRIKKSLFVPGSISVDALLDILFWVKKFGILESDHFGIRGAYVDLTVKPEYLSSLEEEARKSGGIWLDEEKIDEGTP